MTTLTEMKQKIATIRRLLGRKDWEYVATDGTRVAIEKNHPLYNRFLTHTENAIVISPSMKITHKKTLTKFMLTFDNNWGTMRLKHEKINAFESFSTEQMADFIKNQVIDCVPSGASK